MISTKETFTSWGAYGTTYAHNTADGWKNVQTMKDNGYFSQSPACVWCENYGTDDWYLPATEELRTIYNKKSTINSTLQANNFTPLGTGNYWSSTEFTKQTSYVSYVDFSDGDYNYGYSKSEVLGVRAILAF